MRLRSSMKVNLQKSRRSGWITQQTWISYSFLVLPNKTKKYGPKFDNSKSALNNIFESWNLSKMKAKQNNAVGKGIEVFEEIKNHVSQLVVENNRLRNLLSQKDQQINQLNQLIERFKTRESDYLNALKRLSKEVLVDPLTQILNRRGLIQAFESQRGCLESSRNMALGVLDIDNFKLLNDKFGHHVGDEALKFTVKNLKEELLAGSTLARYGGEEFVVLFPNTSVNEAQKILARIQLIMSSSWFNSGNDKLIVTFSAGVTQYGTNESIEEALQRADKGLYEAKRTGKNRTCLI